MSLKNFLPLRREVMEHWIYKDSDYFKVWVDMLFRARFSEEPKKDIYEGSLYMLYQGHFLFSRNTWSIRLNINSNKLYKLVNLLIQEQMIEKVGKVGKSGATIYSIVNYQKYNYFNSEATALPIDNTGFEGDSQQPNNSEATAFQQPSNSQATLKKSVKTDKSEKSVKTFVPDSDEYRLSQLLFDLMRKNNPTCKEQNIQSWCKHIDFMIRLDGRTHEQIETIINFSQNDNFWKANILSTSKLREKFDTLTMQDKKKQPSQQQPTEHDRIAELMKKREQQ